MKGFLGNKDRDPNVRALAAEALGLIGSQEAVDA
ncbi:MAG: HEAT repeat domain-containing protein [Candidatus Methylomirabilales bacterium]